MTTLLTLCGTGNLKCWTETGEECKITFTARRRSLRRLCFHRCLPHCMLDTPPRQVHPQAGTPPWADTPGQVHPQGRNPLPSACWDTPPCAVHAGIHPLCSACWDAVNKRAVRIPLECILVESSLVMWHI